MRVDADDDPAAGVPNRGAEEQLGGAGNGPREPVEPEPRTGDSARGPASEVPGTRPEGSGAPSVAGDEPRASIDPDAGDRAGDERHSASDARLVQEYLRRLRSKDVEEAEAAFRELWEVRKRLIPLLLRQIEGDEATSLMELQVIVFGRIGQQDVANDRWVYYVPGLAGVKFDDVASGPTRRPGAFRVVLKRRPGTPGFPVGAVVRAALLNRFRSPDYPSEDDQRDPSGWWYSYYANVRARL